MEIFFTLPDPAGVKAKDMGQRKEYAIMDDNRDDTKVAVEIQT